MLPLLLLPPPSPPLLLLPPPPPPPLLLLLLRILQQIIAEKWFKKCPEMRVCGGGEDSDAKSEVRRELWNWDDDIPRFLKIRLISLNFI